MGVLKFRLTPPDLPTRVPDVRKAYVTGPDRTPGHSTVEVRPGSLTLHRQNSESGRMHVPWPVGGQGQLVVSTATLTERQTNYDLGVELARGKLNDVLNQMSDWRQMGLIVPFQVEQLLKQSKIALAQAVTSRDLPDRAMTASARSLQDSVAAATLLVESYTAQLLKRRLDHSTPLPTVLACGLDGGAKGLPTAAGLPEIFHAARVKLNWASVCPDEGKRRWDDSDAQIQWAIKNGMSVSAGPLIEFRRGAVPDWLWLWQGDFEEIQSQAVDFVREAMKRYGKKVSTWHLVHRPAGHEILGLNEEDQIRLTAQVIQAAKRVAPEAHLVVDFDRPWAEWMASSKFQLGPLHLADSLARAELGLGGIGIEIAPGFSPYGSHSRDLLDFSRLLDLYALVNLPIHVSFAAPSSSTRDALTMEEIAVETAQWARVPDETTQKEWASSWVALAASKPFVRSVTWLQSSDSVPHFFPHSGIFASDGRKKPLKDWFSSFRKSISG